MTKFEELLLDEIKENRLAIQDSRAEFNEKIQDLRLDINTVKIKMGLVILVASTTFGVIGSHIKTMIGFK